MGPADASGEAGTWRWLERWGVAASFGWGLAEGILFFIVPDVIVGAVALFAPRRALRAAGAAVAGGVIGGIVIFAWTHASEASARAAIDAVPAIPAYMFADAGRSLVNGGGVVMLASAFTGTPYKVWALEMTALGWSLPSLVAWTVPARAIRLGGLAALTGLAGRAGRAWISRHPRASAGGWLGIWIVVYAVYWTRTGF